MASTGMPPSSGRRRRSRRRSPPARRRGRGERRPWRPARRAVLPGAAWQKCRFHLARTAIHHAPNLASRRHIGPAASTSGASCAPSGTPTTSRRRRPNAAAWSTATPRTRRGPPAGSRRTFPRGLAVFRPARAPPSPQAHRQPDRARCPAGNRAANPKGPRRSERGVAPAARRRHPRRNRRGTGHHQSRLHRHEHPRCVKVASANCHTTACVVDGGDSTG